MNQTARPSAWEWPTAAWAASSSWARRPRPGACTSTTGCRSASRPSTPTKSRCWTPPCPTAWACTVTFTKVTPISSCLCPAPASAQVRIPPLTRCPCRSALRPRPPVLLQRPHQTTAAHLQGQVHTATTACVHSELPSAAGDGRGLWVWGVAEPPSSPPAPGVVWQLPGDDRPPGPQFCALPAEAGQCHQQLQYQPHLGHRPPSGRGAVGATTRPGPFSRAPFSQLLLGALTPEGCPARARPWWPLPPHFLIKVPHCPGPRAALWAGWSCLLLGRGASGAFPR